jgi:shikimate kinase
VAKKKGVWLEHRSKGKLLDATRTYWLVDDQELAAFLPKQPEENPISVADPVPERCPNAHLGCSFVGTSINSLNAHKRFCSHTPKPKNMRGMRATAPTKASNAQQSTADRTKGPMKAGNKRALKKLKPTSTRSKTTSKQQSRAAAQQGSDAFEPEGEGGFDAEEQEPTPAVAKQVMLILAGGVVVIVLVQIKLLEKTLAQAQKELSRVLIANKGLKEKAGRLEKANRVLETEGASVSQQLLQLEKELAQLKQEAPMQPPMKPAPMQPPMKPAPMQPPMQQPTQQPAPMQQQKMQQQEGEGGFDAEEQDPSTAAAKQVRLIVAGGVVVIVLVQINLLGKALLKAQKELAMQQQPMQQHPMQQPMQYQPMQYQQQPMQQQPPQYQPIQQQPMLQQQMQQPTQCQPMQYQQ